MNFVKRAGLSLCARKSRAAALLGIFVVLCTLLLGDFQIRSATARQEADAQRDIGVDVTVRGKDVTLADVDRLGARAPVNRYNTLLPDTAEARNITPLGSGPSGGSLTLNGVRDLGLLLPFSYGSMNITAGHGITPADAGRKVAVIEQRLARSNRLKLGDTVRVRSADGRRGTALTVIGIFRDPTQDPPGQTAPQKLPGNALYVPVRVVRQLSPEAKQPSEAVFRIGAPDQAEHLHALAERLLGAGAFDFRVNDKAYRDQVRPIQRVGAFAGLIVWVIALAGALILALIVALQIRERRAELGMLLAMGEKKWKLIGQHAVEVAVVALPAVAIATVIGLFAAPSLGEALPAGRGHAPEIRVEPVAVGKVAGISLSISLAATVLPGMGILRLHPRSILTDTE